MTRVTDTLHQSDSVQLTTAGIELTNLLAIGMNFLKIINLYFSFNYLYSLSIIEIQIEVNWLYETKIWVNIHRLVSTQLLLGKKSF